MFCLLKKASHRDVSFGHTEHTLILAKVPAEVCFVCLKGASHRDIASEHTDNAFWWEIMKNYRQYTVHIELALNIIV